MIADIIAAVVEEAIDCWLDRHDEQRRTKNEEKKDDASGGP